MGFRLNLFHFTSTHIADHPFTSRAYGLSSSKFSQVIPKIVREAATRAAFPECLQRRRQISDPLGSSIMATAKRSCYIGRFQARISAETQSKRHVRPQRGNRWYSRSNRPHFELRKWEGARYLHSVTNAVQAVVHKDKQNNSISFLMFSLAILLTSSSSGLLIGGSKSCSFFIAFIGGSLNDKVSLY